MDDQGTYENNYMCIYHCLWLTNDFRFRSALQEADNIASFTLNIFLNKCGYSSNINELPRKLVSTNKFCFSAIIDPGELLDSKDFD